MLMQLHQGLTYGAKKDILFFNNAWLPEVISLTLLVFIE